MKKKEEEKKQAKKVAVSRNKTTGKKGKGKKTPDKSVQNKGTKNSKKGKKPAKKKSTTKKTATKTQNKRPILTVAQYKAIDLMVAYSAVQEKRTMGDIAKEVGVARSTLYEWIDKDEFQKEMNRTLEKERRRYHVQIQRAFFKKCIQKADAPRIKLYHEIYEGYVPKSAFEANVEETLVMKIKRKKPKKSSKKK